MSLVPTSALGSQVTEALSSRDLSEGTAYAVSLFSGEEWWCGVWQSENLDPDLNGVLLTPGFCSHRRTQPGTP